MVQTKREIMTCYNTTRNLAELVEEYLKETNETDDLAIFSISYMSRCKDAYEKIYRKELTLEEAQAVYKFVPQKIREHNGDKYLLGLLEFLKLSE